MRTHAANTVAQLLEGDKFRIYFSSRDDKGRSHITYIDMDLKRPGRVVSMAETPALSPGPLGTFDDSGVSLSCITKVDGKTFLYYVGWNLGVTVPWRNSIGLAVWNELSGRFEKFSEGPIMDRDVTDPYSISYPFVLSENGRYRMWYGSNLSWGSKKEDMSHLLKYAESDDGITWRRTGIRPFEFKDISEYAISRPFVIREHNIYRMWYSYRGAAYRIGYAESDDGIRFTRRDEDAGIAPSVEGWDSESIEYPFLFEHKGSHYMLYNGNGYGRSGFGLAILE